MLPKIHDVEVHYVAVAAPTITLQSCFESRRPKRKAKPSRIEVRTYDTVEGREITGTQRVEDVAQHQFGLQFSSCQKVSLRSLASLVAG